ncbi:hypothetical protein [Streptomyces sp. HUAS TT7]|uniref:hypothetical protein n=1 Tax=Streptomyces sp. HUAS TT7 TaxID=3447507 RepID=UPI003F65D5DC
MSWDVLLLHLPDDVASVQDIPHDYTPPSLGRQQDILAAVSEAAPEADLSDAAWGELLGPAWFMELNIGSKDPVDSIMLHIRGSGDDVLVSIVRLAKALGCKALDTSTGGLITSQDASGWHEFQGYRDRVTGAAE